MECLASSRSFVILCSIFWVSSNSLGVSNGNCAELVFLHHTSDVIHASSAQDTQVTFAVDWNACLSSTVELIIKISKKESSHLVDECRLTHSRKSCRMSKTSVACSCLSGTGPVTFVKRFSKGVNLTYIWSWLYRGGVEKERIVTFVVNAMNKTILDAAISSIVVVDATVIVTTAATTTLTSLTWRHVTLGATFVADCKSSSDAVLGWSRGELEMIALYLCLLTFSICIMSVQAAKTACTVPSVREMQSTTLTCHLPEDVSQSKKDFTVYHYSDKEKPDDVLSCFWTDDQPTCTTKEGYVFDDTVSNSITLSIPRVTKDKIGKYTCQITGSKAEDMEYCELSVVTGRTTCEVQSVELMSNTSLHCYFPEDISQSKTGFAIYHANKLGSEDCVVSCVWLSDQLKCFTKNGYERDETATDNFTLHIPRVTADKAGKYTCKMSGSKAEDTSVCELSVKGETICEVKVMPMASLHCYFPEDIGQSRKDFKIYHTNDDKSQERVAACVWMSDQLKCITSEGYECDETVTDNFTLHIPRVTADKTGKYTCQISGSKEDVSFCKVSIGVEKTGNHLEANTPAIIASITVLAVFLLLVLGICLLCKARCSQTAREYTTHEKQTKITIDPTEGPQISSVPRSGQQSEEINMLRKMCMFFPWIQQRIIGTTSIQEEAFEHQKETKEPLLRNDQQQASTGKHSHRNCFSGTLQVLQEDDESEKGENPSPRLSPELCPEFETSENFVGKPCPELETSENFEDDESEKGENPSPRLSPELETSENFEDELWERPLHMNPADNSKEADISKTSPLYSKHKKKKKRKDLEEPGDVDDLRECCELRGQTANKEGDKKKRKSLPSLLKRNKQKEDTGHKRSTENSPQAEAQPLTPHKQKLLMAEHSDSDEATNALLARERPQEKSKEQTFQRNQMRHTYSPGRESPMQRDRERASFPQEARRRPKKRNKQGNDKSGSPGHLQEASDREGADDSTNTQTARKDSREKPGKEKTK